VRKLLTWIIVSVGIAALVRKLRRRRGEDASTADVPSDADDPADELRQRLASTRVADPEPAAEAPLVENADPPVDPPTPEPTVEPSIDERRTEVHDEGRAAIDEMRKSAED
jgi:hypothetical protein